MTTIIYPTTVTAKEEYDILFKNEEVTDIDGLMTLYQAQEKVKKYNSLINNDTNNANLNFFGEETNRITVNQILEARKYDDGRIVYTGTTSGISAIEDNKLLSSSEIYKSLSKSSSWSMVSVVFKIYFTFYIQDADVYVRLESISSKLVNKSSVDFVKIEQMYKIGHGFGGAGFWTDTQTLSPPTLQFEHIFTNRQYLGFTMVSRLADYITTGCKVYVNGDYKFEIKFISAEISEFCYDFVNNS